jgi:hypothetical protein
MLTPLDHAVSNVALAINFASIAIPFRRCRHLASGLVVTRTRLTNLVTTSAKTIRTRAAT